MHTTTKDTQNENEIKPIDIFYKDTYRIESLISQINNGALQSSVITANDKQGSSFVKEGSINALDSLKGNLKKDNSKSHERILQKNIKNIDDVVIKLLQMLGLTPQDSNFDKLYASLNSYEVQ